MKYPFTPEVLDALPEELAELYRSLEATLLEEICSRLKISGELNEVTVQDIRALRSHGIDLGEIEKAIQRTGQHPHAGSWTRFWTMWWSATRGIIPTSPTWRA